MAQAQDRNRRTSGEIAKARTELTVASDRLDCSQEETTRMREELMHTLSKYMSLDNELFEIQIQIVYRTKRGVRNVKTIPIK